MSSTASPTIRHVGCFVPHSSAALIVLTILSCLVNSMASDTPLAIGTANSIPDDGIQWKHDIRAPPSRPSDNVFKTRPQTSKQERTQHPPILLQYNQSKHSRRIALNYSLRANGMSIYTFVSNAAATVVTFAFPYALAAIGWKTYMISASWDVLEIAFIIWYWVETSNKTLEEIYECIDGEYHSNAPVLMGVIKGEVDVEVKEGLEVKVIQFPTNAEITQ